MDTTTTTARTYLVTGAASGIGGAVAAEQRRRGHRVISLDRAEGVDVRADLADPDARHRALQEVRAAVGTRGLDAVIACAGITAPAPVTVHVNYFGVVDILEGLRPLLAQATAARAIAVTSVAALHAAADDVVASCLDGDEGQAHEQAEAAVSRGDRHLLYASSKVALARWVRRRAAAADWAGAGIPLNAVAPGIVDTALVQRQLEDPAARAQLDEWVPMPLRGPAAPEEVAAVIDFLLSPQASLLTGQVIYADGGADAALRADRVW